MIVRAFSALCLALNVANASGATDNTTRLAVRIDENKPLVSNLTVQQVKEIAAARVRDAGYPVKASDPWSIALQIGEAGPVWAIQLLLPSRPTPFWLQVDDVTGNAEMMAPIIHGEQRFAANADWLVKVDQVLGQAKYPIELETLMRGAHFAGAEFSMGGRDGKGRLFLDYTLRQEKDGPARFDVRCYFEEPEGTGSPKIVTAAEIAYIDAKLYRYRLVRDRD